MANDVYEINVVYDGRWKVRFNGHEYGPFPSQEAARDAAIGAGSRAATLGIDTSVSIDPSLSRIGSLTN